MASAIGRDLSGLSVLTRGLQALMDTGMQSIGASQGPRNVDVQFILERDDLSAAIQALHATLIEGESQKLSVAA